MKAKRKLSPVLRRRREEQTSAMMLAAHEVVVYAIKNLFDRGMTARQVGFYLSGMENAAGRAITTHLGTTGDIDSQTGFWTVDSVGSSLTDADREEYGRHLADAIEDEHKKQPKAVKEVIA